MNNIGPDLEILTHRLAETPREFLEEPRIGSAGIVQVGALINDVRARTPRPTATGWR